MKKKIVAIICLLTILSSTPLAGCSKNGRKDGQTDQQEIGVIGAADVDVSIKEVSKHGNLLLDTTFAELNAAGIEIGDIIIVKLGDRQYNLPVGAAYTDVDSGEMLCRFDLEDNEVALGINYGSFAEETGAAEKRTTEAEPGYQWELEVTQVTTTIW